MMQNWASFMEDITFSEWKEFATKNPNQSKHSLISLPEGKAALRAWSLGLTLSSTTELHILGTSLDSAFSSINL